MRAYAVELDRAPYNFALYVCIVVMSMGSGKAECFDKFSDNFIDGSDFMKLTEAEVKDLVPPIGLAKKIICMIPKVCVCVCVCGGGGGGGGLSLYTVLCC